MSNLVRRAAELIAEFEGFFPHAYRCPAGIWTIGFGSTHYSDGRPVREGDKITREQAMSLLEMKAREIQEQLKKMVPTPLTEDQQVALISLIYNAGIGAFANSKMLAKIKVGDLAGAAEEFDDWIFANGQPLPGLIHRRQREKEIFLRGLQQQQINLHDFFRYYDHNNPKHRAAVEELKKHIPSAQLLPTANWVRIYRQPWQPERIDWTSPEAKVSEFFSVGEVTQRDPRRIPKDPQIQQNIVRLARRLDQIRRQWGGPIGVTSWYRPPEINRQVGGSPNSWHLQGLAADVYPVNGRDAEFERWLDGIWEGGLGYGIRSGRGFVHLDLGPRRRWSY